MTRNFKEIGVREIAEKAGVSPASIYNFFGSKEELAKEIIFQQMEEKGEELKCLINADLPFKVKTKKLLDMSFEKHDMLTSEGVKNFVYEDPTFRKHVEDYAQNVSIPMFISLIEQGKLEGEIADSISTRTLLMFIMTLTSMMSNPDVRDNMDVQLRKEFAHLFMYGIFGNSNK